jgi:hypothetical protein
MSSVPLAFSPEKMLPAIGYSGLCCLIIGCRRFGRVTTWIPARITFGLVPRFERQASASRFNFAAQATSLPWISSSPAVSRIGPPLRLRSLPSEPRMFEEGWRFRVASAPVQISRCLSEVGSRQEQFGRCRERAWFKIQFGPAKELLDTPCSKPLRSGYA